MFLTVTGFTLTHTSALTRKLFVCLFQVKRLKGQLEQKKPKNGTEDASSPDGDVLENGADSNILDLQSKKLPATFLRAKVWELFLGFFMVSCRR